MDVQQLLQLLAAQQAQAQQGVQQPPPGQQALAAQLAATLPGYQLPSVATGIHPQQGYPQHVSSPTNQPPIPGLQTSPSWLLNLITQQQQQTSAGQLQGPSTSVGSYVTVPPNPPSTIQPHAQPSTSHQSSTSQAEGDSGRSVSTTRRKLIADGGGDAAPKVTPLGQLYKEYRSDNIYNSDDESRDATSLPEWSDEQILNSEWVDVPVNLLSKKSQLEKEKEKAQQGAQEKDDDEPMEMTDAQLLQASPEQLSPELLERQRALLTERAGLTVKVTPAADDTKGKGRPKEKEKVTDGMTDSEIMAIPKRSKQALSKLTAAQIEQRRKLLARARQGVYKGKEKPKSQSSKAETSPQEPAESSKT